MRYSLPALLLLVSLATDCMAVRVTPDGNGQALVFPLYSTERMDTLLTIRSSSDAPTVASVSIREGQLGTEALSFFVYLGPRDTFTAALTDLARIGADDGPGILVPDDEETCTVPEIGDPRSSVPGRRFQRFLNVFSDAAGADRSALRSGYIEVVALGGLDDFPFAPDDCRGLAAAWGFQGPLDAAPGTGLVTPDDALSGHAILVDAGQGESYSYRATALQAFRATPLAVHPSDIPPLGLASDASSAEVTIDGRREELGFDTSLAAVSAALAASSLAADVNIELALASATEIVLTLPTYHAAVVAPRLGGETATRPPFVDLAGRVRIEYEMQFRSGRASDGCDQIYFTGQGPADHRLMLLDRAVTSIPMGAGWDRGGITGRRAAPLLWEISEPAPYFDIGTAPSGVLRLSLASGDQPAFDCQDAGLNDAHRLPLAAGFDAADSLFGLPLVALTLTRIRNESLGDAGVLANYGLVGLTTVAAGSPGRAPED